MHWKLEMHENVNNLWKYMKIGNIWKCKQCLKIYENWKMYEIGKCMKM